MGLRIALVESQPVEVFTQSVSGNLAKMAQAAGLYGPLWHPDENGVRLAGDLIAPLKAGIDLLESDRSRFEAMSPSNGWGDYASLLAFVKSTLDACVKSPASAVVTS